MCGFNGAIAHTSRRSRGILREMFLGHVVSLRGDIGWPQHSPDLTLCDFFLWGYLSPGIPTSSPKFGRS
jgi:hypothetical protein